MNALDMLTARTQRNISYLWWLTFALVLGALIFLPKPLDELVKTILLTMIGVLGTLVTMQNQFWFARNRSTGVPDAGTTVTTTASTLTNGDPNAPSPTSVIPAPGSNAGSALSVPKPGT